MGLSFGGLSKAKAEGRNARLDQNGDYAFVVTKVCERESTKGNGISYVIETTILESNNPTVGAGEDRTLTINRLDSNVKHLRELAFMNLKGFLAACLSDINGEPVSADVEALDGDEQGWEKAAKASLDEGLCNGCKVRVKIQRTDTEKSKDLRKAGAPLSAVEECMFPVPKFRAYNEAV
jgi:hypothetical protein